MIEHCELGIAPVPDRRPFGKTLGEILRTERPPAQMARFVVAWLHLHNEILV